MRTGFDRLVGLMRAAERPAVTLDVLAGEPVPKEPTSSIGGRPSLAASRDWPIAENERPMLFLAQLGYADLPKLPEFPREGLLSLFVEDRWSLGAHRKRGERAFEVIWEPTITGLVRRELPSQPMNSPFGDRLALEGAPIVGRRSPGYPRTACNEYEALEAEVYRSCSAFEEDGVVDVIEVIDEWLETQGANGSHTFGGFPEYVQRDPRRITEDPHLDRVLLQLGCSMEREWRVMFGDAGIARLLITHEDLAARAFDRAAYSWDCG